MSTNQAKQTVRIVTDTTASLPSGYAAAHDLPVVPQVIMFGEESYLEDREITYAEFVRRLKVSAQLPKTAAPPPAEFVAAYQRELARAQTILSIHPTADASGTVRSALAALDQAEGFGKADIRVIDTRTIGGALGMIVMAAVEWAESGLGADEIQARVQDMIIRSRTYFLISTLEYLQKGGRIGGAAALVGSILQIKPVLHLTDGHIEVLEKVRSHQRAYERLIGLVLEQCPRTAGARLCVQHADAPDEAERLAATLREQLGIQEIPVLSVGSAITTHAGPGVLAVAFFV